MHDDVGFNFSKVSFSIKINIQSKVALSVQLHSSDYRFEEAFCTFKTEISFDLIWHLLQLFNRIRSKRDSR